MFERFNDSARRCLFFARYEVTQLGGVTIEPEHLVLGVLKGARHLVMRFATASESALRTQLEDGCRQDEKVPTSAEIPFSDAAKAALEGALIEAEFLKNRWIRPEHIILGVIAKTGGAAVRVLHEGGVHVDAIRDYLRTAVEDAAEAPDDLAGGRFMGMIGIVVRQWRGVAKPGCADDYIRHLRRETIPSLRQLAGFIHVTIMRREVEDGTEFQVVTFWRSLDAIKAFAGDDIEAAVVPPAARALLSRYDDRVTHYEMVNREDVSQ